MVAALIRNGIVENLIQADANVDAPPFEDTILVNVDDTVLAGSTYDYVTGLFTPPELPPAPVIVPDSVTPRQVRLLLLQQNLLSQVVNTISQMDEATRITWEYALEFQRNDPLLISLSQQLELTEQQVDDFFIAASQL